MLDEEVVNSLHLFHLCAIEIRLLLGFVRYAYGVQIQKHFQNLHPEIGDADPLRHTVHFAEDMLHYVCTVHDFRIVPQLPAGDDLLRRNREILYLLR